MALHNALQVFLHLLVTVYKVVAGREAFRFRCWKLKRKLLACKQCYGFPWRYMFIFLDLWRRLTVRLEKSDPKNNGAFLSSLFSALGNCNIANKINVQKKWNTKAKACGFHSVNLWHSTFGCGIWEASDLLPHGIGLMAFVFFFKTVIAVDTMTAIF